MEADKTSITAWGVAMARAAHVRFDPPPHVFDDSLAFELIDPEFQAMIDMFGPSDRVDHQIYRNRPYLSYRQYYQEACLARAYAEGARQFVILGAGMDAYAFRQDPAMADVQIYEIDFPSTQAVKQARIDALGWTMPDNLHFVACDFEQDSLQGVLQQAGFDFDQISYFAWMGVTIYLEPATVIETFRSVKALAPSGSSIAFEYALPYDELSGDDKASRDYSLAQKTREHEPFISYFSTEQMHQQLTDLGYTRWEPLDHVMAAGQIADQRDDDLSIFFGFRLARAGW